MHLMWAAGWYVGLHQELARSAFQQRWFLVYDLLVAGVCALGVGVGLALVLPWGARLPRPLWVGLAWCGTVVLVLRGGAGALQTGYRLAAGRNFQDVSWIWEVWFSVGAFLFVVSAWRFSRASRGIERP